MSWYRNTLEAWLKELNVEAETVLDIGGAQLPVKDRVKLWDVKNYHILDLPDYNLEDFDDEFGEGKNWRNFSNSANLVFCLEVFEYLIDPLRAFNNIREVLKADGRAYISFPLLYPVHNEVEFDSLRYTETGIRRLAREAGLKVNQIWYRKPRSQDYFWLFKFYVADGMRMAKGVDHQTYGYIVELSK